MMRIAIGGALAVGALFPAMAAMAEPLRYKDLCEASAAVALDGERFLVVSDDMDVALVYRRGVLAPEGPSILLPEVSDLEGAARIGDTVFLMTGHSVAEGPPRDDKKKRKQLIALQIAADGTVAVAGKVYRGLRADVQARVMQVLPNTPVDAKDDSVANFEGLAATPEGSLLVGLRAPVTEGAQEAVVVRIDAPFALVGLEQRAQGAPSVDEVSHWPLEGRGIRSLEAMPGGGYLIVAGPVADGGVPPAQVYAWDGKGAPVPKPVEGLGQIKPEAAFYWPDRRLTILGDNGGEPQPDGGTPCSDDKDDPPGDRWFPALDVAP